MARRIRDAMDMHADQLGAAELDLLARPRTVSGLYRGEMTLPQPGRFVLELRVDVDSRSSVSPVMNRISGDLYQITRTVVPGMPPKVSQTYIESWIVDHPQVTWSAARADIKGRVRFWTGVHAATTVAIRIAWPGSPPAVSAAVTFTETGGAQRSFSCRQQTDCFRSVQLEIDVCKSVNKPPLRPAYDTHWHDNRPTGLPQRVLTIESAYREAGVCITVEPTSTVVDDTAAAFSSWSPAELHDAMETHFSHYGGSWPKWQMWGLMAGLFEDAGVGGVMFDAASQFGGAGKAPERQGFAVFRNHPWFDSLVPGTPQNQAQAQAMRHFLYTWVHEAGHAFNFLHSWNKGRPDSLSWMNYDWRYDSRNGADTFWNRFPFRFDDDELIHLRHGNRAAVIMGGDPWSSGGHLEAPNLAMAQVEGDAPLELIIRSKEYFDLMEPVLVELRLRNLMTDMPVVIDKRLAPEFGGVVVYIQKPDGHVVQYDPVICAVGTPEFHMLAPAGAGEQGEDRFSREIFLSYGSSEFYFDRPGEYRIRAVYQGSGDVLIPSEAHRIRIGIPASKETDRLAQDYFSDDVGLALYLQGSRSPFLAKGAQVLEEVAERCKGTVLGAKVAMTLAHGVSRPFHRIALSGDPASWSAAERGEGAGEVAPERQSKIVRTAAADPKRALELTRPALQVLREQKGKEVNLALARVVRRRAEYHQAVGDPERARQELGTLRDDLAARGANASVLKGYEALAESIDSDGPQRRRRKDTDAARPRKPRSRT
jgi:hypothetical protein